MLTAATGGAWELASALEGVKMCGFQDGLAEVGTLDAREGQKYQQMLIVSIVVMWPS